MKIIFKENELHNESFIITKEWFEGNVHGCFANQSIIGINTRRYHGLFNLNRPEYEEPISILATLEENLTIDDFTFPFSSSQFNNVTEPKGYVYLKEFQYLTHPQFNFQIKNIFFYKELLILSQKDALIIHYRFEPFPKRQKVNLVVKPFFTFKKILSFKHKDPSMSGDVYQHEQILEYRPYSTDFCLYMAGTKTEFINSPLWYYNFYHALDYPRPSSEDYFNPGFFEIPITEPGSYYLVFSTEPINAESIEELFQEEKRYRFDSLNAHNEKHLIRKGINNVLHKYFYFYDNVIFLKNSPMDNRINLNTTLWSLPGLLYYDKFLHVSKKIKESWNFVRVKNFLPDRFHFHYASRVFETPLPNMFYIIISQLLQEYSKEAYTHILSRSASKEFLENLLKERFKGIVLKDKALLAYEGKEGKIVWEAPFGMETVPLKLEVDEYLLNYLWYNCVSAIASQEKSLSFGFFKRLNLGEIQETLQKYLKKISQEQIQKYPTLTKILLLALPENPLPVEIVVELRKEIEENLTPYGLKYHPSSDEDYTFYLPQGYLLYLFYLKRKLPATELLKEIDHYLSILSDTLFQDTLMHLPEAYIEQNGKISSFGYNMNFFNLSLTYFWFVTRLLFEEQ